MTSAPSSPSDQALLDAFLRDGDEVALRRVVERLTPALFRVARGLTGWRTLGAQTIVERAWQAAFRAGDQLGGEDRALLHLLLREVVERSAAVGDSPHPQLADEPERAEAMRAVALLPAPSRAVFVLHDIGGLPSAWVAELLGQPLARVVAELWHARLAVETLRGNAAEPLAPDGTDEPAEALEGVAPIWLEEPPGELLERIREHAVHRRATLASRPAFIRRRLDLAGTILAASVALLGAGAWAVYEARSAASVAEGLDAPSAHAAPVELPGRVVTASPPAARPVRQAAASRRERVGRTGGRTLRPPAGGPTGAVASAGPAAAGQDEATGLDQLAAAERDSTTADSAATPDRAPRLRAGGGGAGAVLRRSGRTAFSDETRRHGPPPDGHEQADSGRAATT